MAMQAPLANDKKRVKVYELRDNDWFDRGTGFCTGQVINDEPRIYVESEDEPDRMLLETKIVKEDGYQKQQDTLIVWTETNGPDMALSFQEAEGCAVIWEFVHQVQQQLLSMPDDGVSDDGVDNISTSFTLNPPELRNLDEIEQNIRQASITQGGRDALAKFLLKEHYVERLIPLVEIAEDLESLQDLHRLCNIMKALILMNDNTVIEHLVTDDIIIGTVGALEYDPDFPTHKANHRQYLSDESRYKEVVEIKDPNIKRKIRQTWRLQYLKDVVLARILDDPTFGVLNSLIFFNQVDIVQHLQNNTAFLKELFSIFSPENNDVKRKEQAVHFLQQCAAIAKTLQMQARANLLNNFIAHGLFSVITFAVKHPEPSMRTTGIDILVALLDHDPNMMRGYMLKAVHEKKTPLTDTLIELLHAETDLGVKNQLADAIKILLDPQPPSNEPMANRQNSEFITKLSRPPQMTDAQQKREEFAQENFDRSCRKLFKPLKDLELRESMQDFSYQEVSLFSYLVEILTFFVRQHSMRSRSFIISEDPSPRAAQLLQVPQKPLKLTALKFFRTCISLQDQFYAAQVIKSGAFGAILGIVIDTMPRDNLLNSACLELFEFIKREAIKPIMLHLGECYRQQLQDVTYVDTFEQILLRFEQLTTDHPEPDHTLFSQDDATPPMNRTHINGRWQGLQEMDANEEDYFNTSDDEDEEHDEDAERENGKDVSERMQWHRKRIKSDMMNGAASPISKPLVDYPDDDEDENMDAKVVTPQTPLTPESAKEGSSPESKTDSEKKLQPSPDIKEPELQHPPERVPEKRRRQEDDDEDELGKLSGGPKRRNSSSSASSLASSGSLKRKKGFLRSKQAADQSTLPSNADTENHVEGRKPRKIAISLSNSTNKPDDSPTTTKAQGKQAIPARKQS
ncbi:Platinum sensitivity protein [Exophiala xenobiotica]|nr:Platinum sensitivity protein [Exophiala xenobiotica]